jgi:hypothetical protein
MVRQASHTDGEKWSGRCRVIARGIQLPANAPLKVNARILSGGIFIRCWVAILTFGILLAPLSRQRTRIVKTPAYLWRLY